MDETLKMQNAINKLRTNYIFGIYSEENFNKLKEIDDFLDSLDIETKVILINLYNNKYIVAPELEENVNSDHIISQMFEYEKNIKSEAYNIIQDLIQKYGEKIVYKYFCYMYEMNFNPDKFEKYPGIKCNIYVITLEKFYKIKLYFIIDIPINNKACSKEIITKFINRYECFKEYKIGCLFKQPKLENI